MITRKLTALVLAAGGSTRCPGGKLTRHYQGRPLLSWLLERLERSELIEKVYLVCGFQAEQVEVLAQAFPKVTTVRNEDWPEGLSTSLKCGIESLPEEIPGVLICLGDTPFFSDLTLQRVIGEVGESDSVILPCFEGKMGHPKYFPSWLFPELLQLSGDEGARPVLRRFKERTRVVQVDDPGILKDFDFVEVFL